MPDPSDSAKELALAATKEEGPEEMVRGKHLPSGADDSVAIAANSRGKLRVKLRAMVSAPFSSVQPDAAVTADNE